MILGAHCPVRQGYAAALEEALRLGCRAMQMLPYRRHCDPTSEELKAFRDARKASPVEKLIIHSRFVPSPGSSDADRRARSRALLRRELELADALGADAYVLHAGAYSEGSSREDGLGFVAETASGAVREAGVRIPVLFENVPGGGRRLGGDLDDLGRVLEGSSRGGGEFGLCLDTAHAWAAGHDIASAEGMLRFLAKLNRLFGAEKVMAFHLADTKALLGTRLEDHRSLGEGYLGDEGLRVLVDRPEYEAAPAIIETPIFEGSFAQDLDFLKES